MNDFEFKAIETIVGHLKIFKQVCNILSGEKYATLPAAVVALNLFIDRVKSMVENLNKIPERNSLDETLFLSFPAGRDKILKHYKKCNWVYCIVLILDPRYKTRGFSLSSWGKDLEEESIKQFKKMFEENYFYKYLDSIKEFEISAKRRKVNEGLLDLKSVYPNRNETIDRQSEISQYLNLPCANEDVNISHWWRDHENVYPILAKMVRDLLRTMATSVPVERFFSNVGRIRGPRRRMLKDDVIQALATINSWLKSDLAYEICGYLPKDE